MQKNIRLTIENLMRWPNIFKYLHNSFVRPLSESNEEILEDYFIILKFIKCKLLDMFFFFLKKKDIWVDLSNIKYSLKLYLIKIINRA